MPLTKLDDMCALVLIDLQKGVVGLPTAHPAGEIVDGAARLAQAFRAKGLPVVLVNVTGRAPGRTDAGSPRYALPRIRPSGFRSFSSSRVMLRSANKAGALSSARPLDAALRERGVTQIVLGGIATSIGVESTARSAYDHGYTTALVVDAMTDLSAEAHAHSVEKIFPRLGEVCRTADVLQLVNERV